MLYRLEKDYGKLGIIKSTTVIEQLDMIDLKVGQSYVVTLGKRVLRVKVLSRFGQTIKIKFVWVSKGNKLKKKPMKKPNVSYRRVLA